MSTPRRFLRLPLCLTQPSDKTKLAHLRNAGYAQFIQPPPKKPRFNYIIDVAAKWHGSSLHFVSTYACPGPTAISPTFEAKFARMEFVGNSKFRLSFMRHTGKWVVLYERLALDECLDAIQNDPWFQP